MNEWRSSWIPVRIPEGWSMPLLPDLFGTVGIAALCAVDRAGRADTWLSVIEATNDYPVEAEGIETVALVIDPTAVMDVLGAIVGGDEPEVGIDGAIVGDLDRLIVDGPLAPPVAGMDVTHKAMAGWFADMLGELRQLGEQTGMRIVLVTCDSRPQHAYGNLQRSHFFRDARVRSSIGDARRYFAHQRYRIERAVKTTYRRPYITLDETEDGETIYEEHHAHEDHEYVTGTVVVIKDEAEGLPGRIVYGSSEPIRPPPAEHRRGCRLGVEPTAACPRRSLARPRPRHREHPRRPPPSRPGISKARRGGADGRSEAGDRRSSAAFYRADELRGKSRWGSHRTPRRASCRRQAPVPIARPKVPPQSAEPKVRRQLRVLAPNRVFLPRLTDRLGRMRDVDRLFACRSCSVSE